MEKVLLAVDGSASSLRAAEYLCKLVSGGSPMEIHVLNVQEPLVTHVAVHFSEDEVRKLHRENSDADVEAVVDCLRKHGVPYTVEYAEGEIAPTIALKAKETGCDRIIMGTHGRTALSGLVMGSVARKVVHYSDLPVTLVK